MFYFEKEKKVISLHLPWDIDIPYLYYWNILAVGKDKGFD